VAYDHKSVERKWQERWRAAGVHRTANEPHRRKFYMLEMFPYPSGSGLHVGHCEGYTAADIIARWKRMQGFDVLHPFGWDAFGLPAENFAIKTGIHPRVTTGRAAVNFRRQLDSLGLSYDWTREVNTTDPNYVRWTQWIFLQLFNAGLAYESFAPINWCPSCKTGLANEEVLRGRCERCSSPVERKSLRQWMLRITKYADRLHDDLAEVDWPESTLLMQRNWIGRSQGAEVRFAVVDALGQQTGDAISVFTTRPDTLFGATYLVLAPEHELVAKLTTAPWREAVAAYFSSAQRKSDLERTDLAYEKTGTFIGAYAINPANQEKLPIWVADYVLAAYGTGAVMAVPAHDQRDYEFATTFALPNRPVVRPIGDDAAEPGAAFTGEGIVVDSGFLDGLATAEARIAAIRWLERNGHGKGAVSYRIRDWLFSRQRYWGEPIPIVHCPADGAVAVPEPELPVLLPEVDRFLASGTGESPLATIDSWVNTTCPLCGGPARRETNTMPQWAGSCWYYLRYLDPHNNEQAWSSEAERRWMPVDLYIGGAEHAVLHLLYARFWHKVLFDLGHVSTKEPFKKLRHQGIVLAHTYRDKRGHYHHPNEVEQHGDTAVLKGTDETLDFSMAKMSKSLLNGVNPDDVVAEHGADALRLYEMFMGEFEQPKPWDPRAIEGMSRFLRRVARLVEKVVTDGVATGDPNLRLRHRTIRKVTIDLEALKFNTAIAALMAFVNEIGRGTASRDDVGTLVKLIAPFAPHLADEAWERLGEQGFVIDAAWPEHTDELALDEEVTLAVQVNGKLRGTIQSTPTTPEATARARALALPTVARHLEQRAIKSIRIVPGRIVSIVTD
jgi:leucyl-tRNA synthetase